MNRILLFAAVLVFVVVVSVPVNFAAEDQCVGLNKTDCCSLSDTENTTRLCQFVICNGTGGCFPVKNVEPCGVNISSPDTCPSPVTVAPTEAPEKNGTTPPLENMCTGKNEKDCCNVTDSENKTACQYIMCTGDNATKVSGCYNKSVSISGICEGGIDQCLVTTPGPTTPPNKTASPTGPTTQGPQPSCGNLTDKDACCAATVNNSSCWFVNCTDFSDVSKVHLGCHGQKDNLTNICVSGTVTNFCNATEPTPSPKPSSVSPTGGSDPSKGEPDKGRQFDAASFIGGIVLCAGIIAIVFFGLKFYKARTERNYHTLH